MTRTSRDKRGFTRSRLIFLAAILLISSVWLIRDRSKKNASARPNIILVVIDALRADHRSDYGYHRKTDVGLDFFSSRSTRFEECYAPSSWTTPRTASILSGLQPIRHGAYERYTKIPDSIQMISEILKEADWRTCGFSFNHNVSDKTGFDQGFEKFDAFLGKVIYYPDITTMFERARSWINQVAGEPFFLYLHPMNVHGPYRIPKESRADLVGHPPTDDFVYAEGWMAAIMTEKHIKSRDEVPPEYIKSLVDQYDTAVRYSTDRLGEFFKWLDAKDLLDNSLIIVTADHGEELFDHGGFSHGYSLHKEVVSVPLYIKLPTQSQSGTVSKRVSLLDIYPTILDIFDLAPSYEVDGHSLKTLIQAGPTNHSQKERDFLFEVEWPDRCIAVALLRGALKLVAITNDYSGRNDKVLMYDLANDPAETRDLYSDHLVESELLKEEMRQTFRKMKRNAIGEPEDVSDKLDVERLKSLGYVDIKK